MATKVLKVSEIRFAQKTISPTFLKGVAGKPILDTVAEVLERKIRIKDIPPIQVARINKKWYVLEGNRRLWVFKELQKHGHIHGTIEVIDASYAGIPRHKFTTNNNGTSVYFK